MKTKFSALCRVVITLVCVAGSCGSLRAEPLDRKLATEDTAAKLLWFDIRHFGLEGQAWSDVKEPFDRLPAKADGVVRKPVWELSHNSTGIAVRFVTDATAIHARWTLRSATLAMAHMPATGVSGLDLYVKGNDGQWMWLANGRPTAQTNSQALASNIPPGRREYLLYLPLYNGVKSVEIGVAPTSTLSKAPPRAANQKQPIVFWGTSITQGGCASRPGMVHTAILGRRLNREVINLGFSGNGKMEPEVAALLAEIDAAVYVIDCLPNMNAGEVSDRVGPLVEIIRKTRPTTPILLVEDRSYSDSFLILTKKDRNETSRAALKKSFDVLVEKGDKNLHYLGGNELLGNDNEGTVDSSHPTDLGFFRQADAFEPALAKLLK